VSAKGQTRSRYTVCWTVYLDDLQRSQMLRWCRWAFPAHCQQTPGQLIQHGFEQYGRVALTRAREWCDTHPEESGWEKQEARMREPGEEG